MHDTFIIEIAQRKKINKIGSEIKYFGLFFLVMFGLVLVPAKYLPFEISVIYLFEIVSKNIYIILLVSTVLILIGEWLHGMRSYINAILEFHSDSILIISESNTIEIKHFNIKKISGWNNLFHRRKQPNILIKTKTKERYEIRVDIEIFNVLTDTFPNKDN